MHIEVYFPQAVLYMTQELCIQRNMDIIFSQNIGFADLVECYYCGLSRKGWLHNDDPIVFHMQMKPQCKEVVTLIGRGISSCRDLYDVSEQCVSTNMHLKGLYLANVR